MAKNALTQAEKDLVDAATAIDVTSAIGPDEAVLTLRPVIRATDNLNELPYAPANQKKLYQGTAKALRWIAQYFDDKAAAIP